MEQTVSFGGWLRQRRRSFDLTQEELARRVGCATGTIFCRSFSPGQAKMTCKGSKIRGLRTF